MDIDWLLAELSQPGLPEAALIAAMSELDAVAPALLARLDDYLASRRPGDKPPEWLFFGYHLLGSMRWTPAYRSAVRLLAGDREALAALDDATTSTATRVLYSLFDGDWAPLADAATAADADIYIRWGMFDLIGRLAVDGRIPREEVVAFLRRVHADGLLGDETVVWHGWAEAVELLGLREFKPLIERGYAEGHFDPTIARLGEVLASIERAAATGKPDSVLMRLEPFSEDIVAEFSTWDFATPRDAELNPPAAWRPDRVGTVHNPLRHVGRNDPCPCGSGKKFKKCCLAASA